MSRWVGEELRRVVFKLFEEFQITGMAKRLETMEGNMASLTKEMEKIKRNSVDEKERKEQGEVLQDTNEDTGRTSRSYATIVGRETDDRRNAAPTAGLSSRTHEEQGNQKDGWQRKRKSWKRPRILNGIEPIPIMLFNYVEDDVALWDQIRNELPRLISDRFGIAPPAWVARRGKHVKLGFKTRSETKKAVESIFYNAIKEAENGGKITTFPGPVDRGFIRHGAMVFVFKLLRSYRRCVSDPTMEAVLKALCELHPKAKDYILPWVKELNREDVERQELDAESLQLLHSLGAGPNGFEMESKQADSRQHGISKAFVDERAKRVEDSTGEKRGDRSESQGAEQREETYGDAMMENGEDDSEGNDPDYDPREEEGDSDMSQGTSRSSDDDEDQDGAWFSTDSEEENESDDSSEQQSHQSREADRANPTREGPRGPETRSKKREKLMFQEKQSSRKPRAYQQGHASGQKEQPRE